MTSARPSTAAIGGYREWTICVIAAPILGPQGLRIAWQGEMQVLTWREIDRAFAAEVGEPEGVRAVVFDLLSEAECTGSALLRFCLDPSDGPKAPAQTIVEHLGMERCSPSLRALAREGSATDLYSHLDHLDDALLENLAELF